MIITGEKLNSSIGSVKAVLDARDGEQLLRFAAEQRGCGADYLDINAGMFREKEAEVLSWMARELSGKGLPLSVDSPDYHAAAAALEAAGTRGSIINSITLEPERLEHMTSLACEYSCRVVALCLQKSGMPENTETRLRIAGELVEHLAKKGIPEDDIFIDPMLKPLGAEEGSGLEALAAIARIREHFPECHITCGLSNLSFGLPKRRLINRAFAVAAIERGLDAAILDPTDRELMGLVSAAEAIGGRDEYCLSYIGKCREGSIG